MNARRSAALALTASASLVLAACFPPNENPSDLKVDTATEQNVDSVGTGASSTGGQETGAEATATETTDATATGTETAEPAAGGEVMVIDCFGAPAAEPTELTADCNDPAGSQVTDITWDEWTEEEATGTGTTAQGEDAEIELSNPTDTGTVLVFSTVTVNGQPVSN